MNITLKQLHIFLAVARHENLAQAAGDLFLTKGAVSQALQELEKQLGVQLFDRIHPHIRLNNEGTRLRPLADELLTRSHEIGRLFHNGDSPLLHIGASKTIGAYFLPELLQGFACAEGWMPRASIANTNHLLERAATFSLDVVLLEGEKHHADLVTENWLADDMVVVAPKGHPLADGTRHEPEALRHAEWILREPDSGTRAFFEHHLGPLVAPYSVSQSLDSPEAVMGMVERDMGLTLASHIVTGLPEFGSRFALVHLTTRFSRTFVMGYHAKKYHSTSMDRFLAFCRNWSPGSKKA